MTGVEPTPITTLGGAGAWQWLGVDERGRELEIVAVDVDPPDGPAVPARHPRHADRAQRVNTMAKRRPVRREDVDLDREDVHLPDGTRLTRQVADEIVEDVRRKVGRPSLTGQTGVSPRVTFRLTPDVRDRAAAIAEREGKTISQLAREALEERVEAS